MAMAICDLFEMAEIGKAKDIKYQFKKIAPQGAIFLRQLSITLVAYVGTTTHL
jgi:hypothetical protein